MLKNVTEEIEELKKGIQKYTNKKIKKSNITNEIRTNFLFVFTMLITSRTIEEFVEILINIHNVYCSETAESFVIESLNYLRQKCLNRGLDKSNNSSKYETNISSATFNQNIIILEEKQEKVYIINFLEFKHVADFRLCLKHGNGK